MAKAKELYAKIAADEDFAKLAQEYSEGAQGGPRAVTSAGSTVEL